MTNKPLLLIIFILVSVGIHAWDIDLQTAERLAVEASGELKHSREQLNLAALQNKLDLRGFLPSIDISFSSARQVNLYAPDSDSLQLGFSIRQPVFDGGRALKKISLTEIQLELQASELDKQFEALRDKVWQLFYSLLLSREKLLLQKELLAVSSEQLVISSRKYEMGALTELDYLEAAIEVQNMTIDIMDTEAEERSFIEDFALILGFDSAFFTDNPLKLNGSIDREYAGINLWETDFPGYASYAVFENLDLKQKRVNLNRYGTENEILQKSYIPTVALEASFFFRGTGLPLQEPGSSVSLKIEFPFEPLPSGFDGGAGLQDRDQGNFSAGGRFSVFPDAGFIAGRKTSGLKLSRAAEDLELSTTALERSLHTALRKLEHMRLRLAVRRDTQDLLEKRLQIMETRSRMGEIEELELMKARIEYYGEEIGIREGVLELMSGERELEKLIGADFGSLKFLSESIREKKL